MTPGSGISPYLDQFGRLTAPPPDAAWLNYGMGPQALFLGPQQPAPAPAAPVVPGAATVPSVQQNQQAFGDAVRGGNASAASRTTREDIVDDAMRRGFAPASFDNIWSGIKMGLGLMPGMSGIPGLGLAKEMAFGDGITGNTNQLAPSAQAALRKALEAAVPTTGTLARQMAAARGFDAPKALRDFERSSRMSVVDGGLSGAFKKDAQYGAGTSKGGGGGRDRGSAQSRDAKSGSGGRHGRGNTRGGASGF